MAVFEFDFANCSDLDLGIGDDFLAKKEISINYSLSFSFSEIQIKSWGKLAFKININCLKKDPSIKFILKFLSKTL